MTRTGHEAPLTADDVRRARFQTTKFREGYDQDEIDAFLDTIVGELDARAGGTSPRLTAQDVLDAKFQATKFREGYDQDEVDDFLDRVVVALGGDPRAPIEPRLPAGPRDAAQEARAGALTGADVRTVTFRQVRWREGYDILAVEELRQRAALAVDQVRGGRAPSMTAGEVLNHKFPATRWRHGYDHDAVDDFLDVVVAALRIGEERLAESAERDL